MIEKLRGRDTTKNIKFLKEQMKEYTVITKDREFSFNKAV